MKMNDEKGMIRKVTLAKEASAEMTEKKSVFIGHAKPIGSEEEALEFIKAKKKEFSDATHNVFAYVLNGGVTAKYSDDGEPQGTAGMPVLDVIRKSGIDDAVVVVTRYFGGVLLGAGGLVRAYSASAKLALDTAGITVFEYYDEFEIRCGYSDYQRIKNELPAFSVKTDSSAFEGEVTLKIAVRQDRSDSLILKITELTAARAVINKLGERFDHD